MSSFRQSLWRNLACLSMLLALPTIIIVAFPNRTSNQMRQSRDVAIMTVQDDIKVEWDPTDLPFYGTVPNSTAYPPFHFEDIRGVAPLARGHVDFLNFGIDARLRAVRLAQCTMTGCGSPFRFWTPYSKIYADVLVNARKRVFETQFLQKYYLALDESFFPSHAEYARLQNLLAAEEEYLADAVIPFNLKVVDLLTEVHNLGFTSLLFAFAGALLTFATISGLLEVTEPGKPGTSVLLTTSAGATAALLVAGSLGAAQGSTLVDVFHHFHCAMPGHKYEYENKVWAIENPNVPNPVEPPLGCAATLTPQYGYQAIWISFMFVAIGTGFLVAEHVLARRAATKKPAPAAATSRPSM